MRKGTNEFGILLRTGRVVPEVNAPVEMEVKMEILVEGVEKS